MRGNKTYTGRLLSKEKHYGIEGAAPGSPGGSVTYSCVYGYADGPKDRTFKCRVLGDPPLHVDLIKIHGRMQVANGARFSGNGFSFMDYREEDDLRMGSYLLAALPVGLAFLVMVVLALIF